MEQIFQLLAKIKKIPIEEITQNVDTENLLKQIIGKEVYFQLLNESKQLSSNFFFEKVYEHVKNIYYSL